MEEINFTTEPNDLFRQFNQSNIEINTDRTEDIFDYYKFLNYTRHNILHYFVLRCLGRNWVEEERIMDAFDEISYPDEYARKTPDIVHRFVSDTIRKLLIIDVSISMDIHRTSLDKRSKYEPIVNYINDNQDNWKAEFIHVNVSHDNTNVMQEIGKLNDYQVIDFENIYYHRLVDIIEDKKKWCNEVADKEIFERLKVQEFSRLEKSSKLVDVIFMDELRTMNIGRYNDIDIEKEYFDRVCRKNPVYNYLVEKDYDENVDINEDNLANFFKDIIENPNNSLFNKYKDDKLDDDQFDIAKSEITGRNEKMSEMKPKPTHHLLVPIDEESKTITYNDELSTVEQDTVVLFMDEFLKNFEKIQSRHEKLNSKMFFLRDLYKETLWALRDSLDSEINMDIFCDRDYKNLKIKNEYHIHKSKCQYVRHYNMKRNVTTKILSKLELDFSKDNIDMVKATYDQYTKELSTYPEELLTGSLSFRDYLRHKGLIHDSDSKTYVKRNKVTKLSFNDVSEYTKIAYSKSGIKKDILQEEVRRDIEETISMSTGKVIDDMMENLSTQPNNQFWTREDEFLLSKIYGVDDSNVNIYKKKMMKNYKTYYNYIRNTKAFTYGLNCRNSYQQLFHCTQLNTGDKCFYKFNNGYKNYMTIVATSYIPNNNDIGQPFLSIIKTKKPEQYNNGFFGKTYTYKIDDEYFYVLTNWRRLNLSKITFMRDSFYSVLSTTMNTIMSSPKIPAYLRDSKIEKIFSLRMIIGHATNQKIGELLMDTRYAYMSSFSYFTNISKLLVEKFGPPYKTCMETWIINRLLDRLLMIHKKVMKQGILQSKVDMKMNMRDVKTIGGTVDIPSLWGDYNLVDVTEILDEAFIYVHTMKEPASVFHENVKALKTIIEFQDKFDNLPEMIQNGAMRNLDDLKFFLEYDTKIGCSTKVIELSTIHTVRSEKPFIKKIIHQINDESIGEILSTKAVISDIDREVTVTDKIPKKEIRKRYKRHLQIYGKEMGEDDKDKMVQYILTTDSKFYNKHKPRQKVMETILDKIEENPHLNTTVKYANNFVVKEQARVLADICIKSQYGAKREFYVINDGAKALARVTENFFKELSKNSPNESISVPGDKKIIQMQKMLDRIYYNKTTPNHKIMYVNGDCTKWSAAETMASFLAMTKGLSGVESMTENMTTLLYTTFCAWADKKIQIPMDVFNKVLPSKDNGTEYLDKVKNDAKIHSTQNFLQGMFNYASSYKAVCCSNYAYKIWKKIYPDSSLMIEHMEHSDDYEIIVLYENIDDFIKFRVLQKMMMRLHGYNDSDRKTSCQPFLMEFVSQISFNGVMLYPQIKKSKEINLNLPCTGYKTDMEAALSRVGECQRVGCNLSFLYFFQRLHVYCVARAYSILPKMINNWDRDFDVLYNQPMEIFGIPDPFPICSLYCRGNANNYRLFKYGDKNIKKLLFMLYEDSLIVDEKEKYLSENIDYKYSLKTPRFMYEMLNKTTKNLRDVMGLKREEINKFWEENITYKLLKPVGVKNLIMWIKCMFYNRTFLEAYSKTSRVRMTMRLSSFIKTKIIKEEVMLGDYSLPLNKLKLELFSMKEYYDKIIRKLNDYEFIKDEKEHHHYVQLQKILTKCDPTYGVLYEIFNKLRIDKVIGEKDRTIQVAIMTPPKLKTINIINHPQVLMQYIFNEKSFYSDGRKLISRESLNKDLEEIKNRINPQILENPTTMSLLSVFNDLMINKEKRNVMVAYDRTITNIVECVIDSIIFNFLPGHKLNVTFTNVLTIRDPVDNNIIYTKGSRLTKDFYRQCIENICLVFVYLRLKISMTMFNVLSVLDKIMFKVKVGKELAMLKYREILSKIDMDYMRQFNYDHDDKKIIAFLKSVLMNDSRLLDEIVNDVYSFSYRYEERDNPIGGVYSGQTVLYFTYFNTTVKVLYNKKIAEHPLLFVNKYYRNNIHILYNIALRLTGNISANQLITSLNYDRIPTINPVDISNYDKLIYKYKLTNVIKRAQGMDKFIKTENIDPNINVIPVFMTSETLKRGNDHHLSIGEARAICNDDTMCVYLGKSKLYSLPFWRCKQTDNMVLTGDVLVDDLPFQEMLTETRIERYLNDKLTISRDNDSFVRLNPKEESLKIIKEMEKHKIYDFNYRMENIRPNDLIKAVYENPPILRKTYDMKYSTDSNTYKSTSQLKKESETIRESVVIKNEKIGDVKEENIMNDQERMLMTQIGHNMIDFNEDFLIDFDEDDIDAPLMDDILEFDEDESKKTMSRYLGSNDLLKLQDLVIDSKDIFVTRPKHYRRRIEGHGFMVMKLYNLESYYLRRLIINERLHMNTDEMTIDNYLKNLKDITILLNHLYKDNNYLDMVPVLLRLYKLFCYTFIKSKTIREREIGYIINERKIKPTLIIKASKISNHRLNQYAESDTFVLKHVENEEDYYEIEIGEEKMSLISRKNKEWNLISNEIIKLNKFYDNEFVKMYITMKKQETDWDDDFVDML